jgi:uncharacterized protein (TIGR00106 family)
VDLSIFPLDKGNSVSAYVSRAVKIIKDSGLPCKLGSMSTSFEGEWTEVMGVVDRCFEDLKKDCDRIFITMRVDYKKGAVKFIESKINSVEEKL